MKISFILMYAIVILTLSDLSTLSRTAFTDSSTGHVEYNSQRLNKSGNIIVEGIDLTPYHFIRIFAYALIKPDSMFVLGSKKSKDIEMIAISLEDKSSVLVARYPDLHWSLRTANFTVFFMKKLKESTVFLMIEYLDGNIANRYDETFVIIDIYISESGQDFRLINSQKVSESSIAYYRNTKIEEKYLYFEAGNPYIDTMTIGPAKKGVSKIFINDVNNDCFSDILIWKAFYLSRKIEDGDKDDFVIEREELHVMYFNYWDSTFSKPTPLH